MGKPNWKPTHLVSAIGDTELRMGVGGVYRASFQGKLLGETLSGRFTIYDSYLGTVEVDWEGKRLPDDIPF